MTHSEQIEEILYESHSYGIRQEVLKLANQLMIYSNIKPLPAYEQAFNQLVTTNTEQDN